MPQVQRAHCSRCGESVYNCLIDGIRVPILTYIVMGQPADTGPAVDLDRGSPVKVPSVMRELMRTPVARVELCVACFADVFGLALVTADEDPLFDADLDGVPDVSRLDAKERAAFNALPAVEQARAMHSRALEAVRVGRGAPDAKVPRPRRAPNPATPPAPDHP